MFKRLPVDFDDLPESNVDPTIEDDSTTKWIERRLASLTNKDEVKINLKKVPRDQVPTSKTKVRVLPPKPPRPLSSHHHHHHFRSSLPHTEEDRGSVFAKYPTTIGLEDIYERDKKYVITETDLGEIDPVCQNEAIKKLSKIPAACVQKGNSSVPGSLLQFRKVLSTANNNNKNSVSHKLECQKRFFPINYRFEKEPDAAISQIGQSGMNVHIGSSSDVFEPLQSPSQVLTLIRQFESHLDTFTDDTADSSHPNVELPRMPDESTSSVPLHPSDDIGRSPVSDKDSTLSTFCRQSVNAEIHKTLCDREALEAIEQLDKSIDEVILSEYNYKTLQMEADTNEIHQHSNGKVASHAVSVSGDDGAGRHVVYQSRQTKTTDSSTTVLNRNAANESCGESSTESLASLKESTETADASVNTDFDGGEAVLVEVPVVVVDNSGQKKHNGSVDGVHWKRSCGGETAESSWDLKSAVTRPASNRHKEDSAINNVEEIPVAPAKPSRRRFGDVEADRRMSTVTLDGAVVASAMSDLPDSAKTSLHLGHFVVVAIDFGTTFSGYAFSFTRDADNIHMMRKWEGGDPGVVNQKTMTTLLLTPEGDFHSFGFTARDNFHDLDSQEAKRWLYFDKFKMVLHHNMNLSESTEIPAANGVSLPAILIFAHVLRFLKDHALQELSDQSATRILNEDVRWVITVPAIWRQPAKQFMRQAAYMAGIASSEYPDQLLIALEPEAASIYCRKLRVHQLVLDNPQPIRLYPTRAENETPKTSNCHLAVDNIAPGTRYVVVDCGGGTVDITVHEMADENGNLKELHKPSGGPCGSVGVDMEFEILLNDIFGLDFMEHFKSKRPAGFVDLMMAFEARKRNASPFKYKPLNISLPFSFVDFYKKCKGSTVESAIRKYGRKSIQWSSQGMLRLDPDAMKALFTKTVEDIRKCVAKVLTMTGNTVRYLFLVGGFAESQILQQELRRAFDKDVKVIIPQDVSLAVLKGAVLYGLDPTVVHVRRSGLTYGVGVLNRFVPGTHPLDKRIIKDDSEWCTDVFDRFVAVDQSVGLGDVVLRSYTPARIGQTNIVLHIYCSEKENPSFITEEGVRRCGSLHLDLSDVQYVPLSKRREIQTRMLFGDTEVKLTALDVATGKCVKAQIDFLNN